jgi:hypothetical protein
MRTVRPGSGRTLVDDAAGSDVPRVDAAAVGVRAVRAAVVLQRPVVGTRPQDRVVPGDPGVLDDDVAERVPADEVGVVGGHQRAARPRVEDEFGRRGPLSHA